MKRFLALGLTFAGVALAAHVGTILVAPHALMTLAMRKLSPDDAQVNAFQFARRTTAQSRAIVRPSPDLAYASCVYDLEQGPLLVKVPPSPDGSYTSVSVFAGNTDNVAVMDSIRFPKGIRFVLQQEGKLVHPGIAPVIYTSTKRGIILDRRLAPTAEAFALADKARRADSCAPL